METPKKKSFKIHFSFQFLKRIFEDFGEITPEVIINLNLRTIDQLTNLLIYALMTDENSKHIEETLFLETDTVSKVLTTMCAIIAGKKDVFIHLPFKKEMSMANMNVFGALGTIELHEQPPLSIYRAVPTTTTHSNSMCTPVKWQCSCDVRSFLQ